MSFLSRQLYQGKPSDIDCYSLDDKFKNCGQNVAIGGFSGTEQLNQNSIKYIRNSIEELT